MFSYLFKQHRPSLNPRDIEQFPQVSLFTLWAWQIVVLAISVCFDQIIFNLDNLNYPATISFTILFSTLLAKNILCIRILPCTLLFAYLHISFSEPYLRTIVVFCTLFVFLLISVYCVRKMVFKHDIFQLTYINLLILSSIICMLGYQVTVLALAGNSIDSMLQNKDTFVLQTLFNISALFIATNTFFMGVMLYTKKVYANWKIHNTSSLIVVSVALIAFLLLLSGGDLISLFAPFLIIPSLWFCYKFRWWGLSTFVLIINLVVLIFPFITAVQQGDLSLATWNNWMPVSFSMLNRSLIEHADFTFAQMMWFLLTFNLVALFINPLIYELDKVKKSIQNSQIEMADSNDELKLVTEKIKTLNQQLLSSDTAKDQRLTDELQHHVGSNLQELHHQLAWLEQNNPKAEQAQFKKVGKFITHISHSIEEIVHWLHPKTLREKGLVQTLRSDYFAEKLKLRNIKYMCIVDGMGVPINDSEVSDKKLNQTSQALLDENISIVLFRVVQEAVSNAIKYSKAENFIVNLTVLSDEIVLYIMDDGIGLDNAEQKQGFGLSGMANRVKTIGATFHIESYKGTKITVRIPL